MSEKQNMDPEEPEDLIDFLRSLIDSSTCRCAYHTRQRARIGRWIAEVETSRRLAPTTEKALREALEGLLRYADRNMCRHEETYRGGAIWEICRSCEAKWADDEGGRPEYVEPKEIATARALLAHEAPPIDRPGHERDR